MSFSDFISQGGVLPAPKPKSQPIGVKKAQMDSANGMDGDMAAIKAYGVITSANGASAVQEWAGMSEDMADGEKADGLLNLIRGMVDMNGDGELSELEQEAYVVMADAAWAYLESKGATPEDLELIFNSENADQSVEDAAVRVLDLLAAEMPEGDDAMMEELSKFTFDDSALQSAMMDAAYKKVASIRYGRKVMVNKRVSGTVKRSAKQKLALQKAQRRSHNAQAQAMRVKSFKLGERLGLHKS